MSKSVINMKENKMLIQVYKIKLQKFKKHEKIIVKLSLSKFSV